MQLTVVAGPKSRSLAGSPWCQRAGRALCHFASVVGKVLGVAAELDPALE
jgi:hypothetical protein